MIDAINDVPSIRRKPYIVTIFSTKGGVGKTTIAATLAALLGELDCKVLAIDADIQGSLTKLFIDDVPSKGLSELLHRATNAGVLTAQDVVPSKYHNVDLVPSNLNESSQDWLRTQEASGMLLRSLLDCAIADAYDFIIVDSQGSKGQIQRSAALAADLILSPMPPDMLNYFELLTGTIPQIRQLDVYTKYIPDLRVGKLKVLINRTDQTIIAREVSNVLATTLPTLSGVELLRSQIDRANAFNVAMSTGKPLHKSAPNSKAMAQVRNVVEELFPWVDTSKLDADAGACS